MYKPIISQNDINYINLFKFIKSNIWSLLKLPLLVVGIVLIYFVLFKTPSYSSTVSFYTNYQKQGESSFLTPYLGSFIDSQDLNFSVENYIHSDKLLEEICLNKYYINGEEKTLVDLWSEDFDKIFSINPIAFFGNINSQIMLNKNLSIDQRKLHFTKKKLSSSILYKEERLSNLNTITVILRRDAFLTQKIAEEIYNSIIRYSNEITNSKAIEKRDFIQDRVNQVQLDLEKYENDMITFLNSNKSLNSPHLLVKRDRLQRNIDLHAQILANLNDQLEISKIDAKDSTSSIFLLDKSSMSSSKEGISFSRATILVFVIVFILIFSFELYKNRRELFI